MSLFKFLRKPTISVAPVNPEIGEKWIFCQANDPWGPKSYKPVTIIDVRDGWVRYDLFDSRMKVEEFTRMYKKITT